MPQKDPFELYKSAMRKLEPNKDAEAELYRKCITMQNDTPQHIESGADPYTQKKLHWRTAYSVAASIVFISIAALGFIALNHAPDGDDALSAHSTGTVAASSTTVLSTNSPTTSPAEITESPVGVDPSASIPFESFTTVEVTPAHTNAEYTTAPYTQTEPAVSTALSESETNPVNTDNTVIPLDEISQPGYGDCYGRLEAPELDIALDLYFGDSTEILSKGIGQYTGTRIPGRGSRILLCGHNSEGYLAGLKNAEIGNIINVTTDYGSFTYRINKIFIAEMNDSAAFIPTDEGETLVLYTCYPFTSAFTSQRLVCYAEKLTGPVIE